VEPHSQALLHTQPIVSIRVWGVGRDSGRWEQGRGSGVGAQPAVRARPSSLTLLFAALVLSDPEGGTMPNLPCPFLSPPLDQMQQSAQVL